MKNLSPEMIEKAKRAKSTEELVELSCVEKIELTLVDVKNYFEQINSSALNDELLDSVAVGMAISEPIMRTKLENEEDEKRQLQNVEKLQSAEQSGMCRL